MVQMLDDVFLFFIEVQRQDFLQLYNIYLIGWVQ